MKIPTATFVHDWNNFCAANIARIALTFKSCFSVYNHEWLSLFSLSTLELYVWLSSTQIAKLSMLEWQRGSFGRLPYLFPFHFQFHACQVIFVQRVKCYPTPDAPFYRLKAISEFKGNKREEDSIFNTKFSLESIHFRLCFKVFVALEM